MTHDKNGVARLSPWTALLVPALLGGCTVGPDYKKPEAPTQVSYKEAGDEWRQAEPQDAADRGAWWSVYDDPVLDGLEKQVDISNQTLRESEAAYRQAVAIVAEADASFFPTIGVAPSVTRSSSGGGSASGGTIGGGTTGGGGAIGRGRSTITQYSASATASWAPDLWGKIRRTVESDVATAQASAADLAGARLSAQATLASDYFQLRSNDQLKRLLDDTVDAFTRSLKITRDQYAAGTAAKSDVITAQTQLESAQAQEINTGVQRATLEHAIAVLVGKPPSEFSIAPAPLTDNVPVSPTGVASRLLERRPDIAGAERRVDAANAQIGVAISAFYPDLTLSGSYGFSGTQLGLLFTAANNVWSVGGSLSETVFDGGERSAAVDAARAGYDQTVATYRQTVLAGFQQVEDELATLRVLEKQAAVESETVKSAKLAVSLVLNEYKAGTVAYTSVVTAQATALNEEESLLTITQNRLVASVTLIQAIGGGWTQDQLPAPDKLDEAAQQMTASRDDAAK
jgi:NodT family efflux transporter outer membrane factor (OMF) lipoprotein